MARVPLAQTADDVLCAVHLFRTTYDVWRVCRQTHPVSEQAAHRGAGRVATRSGRRPRRGRPSSGAGRGSGPPAAWTVAANRPVAGLVLPNPPPLRRLILRRFGWGNLWLAAGPVAMGVPSELNSLDNATKVHAPAVFI